MQFVLDGQEKEDQRQAALTEQFAALHASGTRASFTVGQPLLAALPPGGPVAPVTFHGVVRVAGRHRSKVRREDLPGGRVETFVVEHINVHHLRYVTWCYYLIFTGKKFMLFIHQHYDVHIV